MPFPDLFVTTQPPERAQLRRVGEECVSLFDRSMLIDEISVTNATCTLELQLSNPKVDKDDILQAMVAVPGLLEFVLSSVNEHSFEVLCNTILQNPPSKAEDFDSSLQFRLLERFSLAHLLLPYATANDAPYILTSQQRSVELAGPALRAITSLPFSDDAVEDVESTSPTSPTVRRLQKKRQQSRRDSRASTRSTRPPVIDSKPFSAYGVEVPTSRIEAARIASRIVDDQMLILKSYLNAFRDDHHAEAFKAAYLPSPQQTLPTNEQPSSSETTNLHTDADSAASGAHPFVQPMKAALYFDNAKGFGAWRIYISTRADRDLRHARKEDAKIFAIYVKKIKELSHGHFTDDNYKRLSGADVAIPIYEAKMTSDTRLVYQIHCTTDFETNIERQVIRIFGIYTHAKINGNFWDCMSKTLGGFGSEYRRRCVARNWFTNQRGDHVASPMEWGAPSETENITQSPTFKNLNEDEIKELHQLLVLEKFVTFSQGLLNSILANQEVKHVFNVSAREKEIIEHPSSCFVMGRSGTGKTTTMLFKMLGIERTWEIFHKDAIAKPRQLFVTQNRVLADMVKDYFLKLQKSLAVAHLSPKELKEMPIEDQPESRRLMLDADEEAYFKSDLPMRYGALEDSHFPMFLTHDHLYRLLEVEFRFSGELSERRMADSRVLREVLTARQGPETEQRYGDAVRSRDMLLTYLKFYNIYWLHFPEDLRKGLSAELVYSEFIGVIKGSEQGLKCDEGYLDEMTYCDSHRQSSATANQREAIYSLFKIYHKRKRLNGHYDPADRTRMLIQNLQGNGIPGEMFDFLYVDEAQDNLLIDAFVLRALCPNPHGMFWAGDTAQTISVGSSFRFNELKALLYRVDSSRYHNMPSPLAKRVQPEMFHLTTNYRSHSAIINCAHSIVQLIMTYWPESIDFLPPEVGKTKGPKPIFFGDLYSKDFDLSLFGDSSGGSIEFGACQCILVRDEAARQRLRKETGVDGQILTLYESKGLEFDDILLYHFFEDSSVDYSSWRLILNSVSGERAPQFEEARHGELCRELKCLYVAITRARMNVWIVDCSRMAEPMRSYWTERGLIGIHVPGTPLPTLAKSSTKEQWATAAHLLFDKKQYPEAELAFARASLEHERQVAHAYHLQTQAESSTLQGRNPTSHHTAYIRAAKAFIDLVPRADAAEKESYYRNAARCYAKGGDDFSAGKSYRAAGLYTLSAQHYRKAGRFDEALEIVTTYRDRMSAEVVESIRDVCRLHFLRKNELAKVQETFEDDKDDEQVLAYMEDYGFDASRASILEERGRYAEAAEAHLQEGDLLEAFRLYMRDHDNQSSRSNAVQHLLAYLWSRMSFGIVARARQGISRDGDTFDTVLRYIDEAKDICCDNGIRDELIMFRALLLDDLSQLAELGDRLWEQHKTLMLLLNTSTSPPSLPTPSPPAALLLCLQVFFSAPSSLDLREASPAEIAICLQRFLAYTRTLQRFACDPNPCSNPEIRKLFACYPSDSGEDRFSIPENSLLYSLCRDEDQSADQQRPQEFSRLRPELEGMIKDELRKYLSGSVTAENSGIFLVFRKVQPCLLFAASPSRRCPRAYCTQPHLDGESDDNVVAYNAFVRIHIQQILIVHTLYATTLSFADLEKHERTWLRRLYETLYPAHFRLGSLNAIRPELIPELPLARRIITVWIRDFLNRLRPTDKPTFAFLSNLLRATRMAMVFDREAALNSLNQIAACRVAEWKIPRILMRGRAFIVHDLVSSMQCNDKSSLNKGILFLNHILGNRLSIDIGVLCDYMDYLCGALIIAKRWQSRGNLHDVTLPKSWIVPWLENLERIMGQDTRLVDEYDRHFGDLLEQIYSGNEADHLLLNHFNFSRGGIGTTRNIFFARICRNLCLWGYNCHSDGLRYRIRRAITAVAKPERDINSGMVAQYVYANDWMDLVRCLRRSTTESAMDEMVHLCHSSMQAPRHPVRNVRRVIYTREEDIFSYLNAVENSLGSQENDVSDTLDDIMDKNATEEDEDEDEEQPVDVANVTESIDAVQPIITQLESTSEEMEAADKIATAYRRYCERKEHEEDEMNVKRRRVYSTFRAHSKTVVWPDERYRLLFKYSVPYLFLAIECTKDYLHAAKKRAKAKLQASNLSHLDLESVQAAVTQTSRLFNDACKLYAKLGPQATAHTIADVETLQKHAQAVEALVKETERDGDVSLEWTADIDLAMAGIF